MKILITGCTALQVKSTNKTIKKIDVPEAIYNALIELGHDVDWRKVYLKEEDFNYDLAIVCIAPLNSCNSPHCLGAIKALSKIKNCIIFYDDWKIKDVQSSLKCFIRNGHKQFVKKWSNGNMFYNDNEDDIVKNEELILKTIDKLYNNGDDNWKILCPMYEWGDKEIINNKLINWVNKDNFNFIDPTSVVIDINKKYDYIQKNKEWVIGTIADHSKWIEKQKLEWNVNYFGCRKLKNVRLKTEEDLINEYNKYYGILSPEYPQSGSGWFRARFVYSALVNSIIYCGQRDGRQLGEAFQNDGWIIETMSEDDLKKLAEKQREIIFSYITDKNYFINKLKNIIKF